MIIFHITPKKNWKTETSDKEYRGDTLDSEGFIHCSTIDQIVGVANRYFKGQNDLLILVLDTNKILPEIRFENLYGGDSDFPHIYGPLNLDAVIDTVDLLPSKDGSFSLPNQLKPYLTK